MDTPYKMFQGSNMIKSQKLKPTLLFAISFFAFSYLSIGQSSNPGTPLSQLTIASPTAASLGKYADFPITYHTGTAEITIPIYTVKSGPLQMPISVSYHASGLKVLETSSWVGSGWALNAGGVISRTVAGAPDDRGLLAAHTQYGHFHDYGYNNYLFALGSTNNCAGVPGCPIGASYPPDDFGIANGTKDGEPDLYFFNFNGYQGKFFFRDDRTPVLVPQQDLKIEPIVADESAGPVLISMPGFVITTPDGTKYYFGKNQEADGHIDAIETTSSINTNTMSITGQDAVSSWYLTKVVSVDNQFSIKLYYAAEKSSNYFISNYPVYNINNETGFEALHGTYGYDMEKVFVDGVRLSQIVFSNGVVNFEDGVVRSDLSDFASKTLVDVANLTAKSLGAISITDNGSVCKKFRFDQTYFIDNSSPINGFFTNSYPQLSSIQSDKYRLRLDAIQEISCDGSISIPPYKFDYYTHGTTPNFAPRKLTFGQDHWGFYNGITNNSSLVPTYLLKGVPQEGADREAHWPAMRDGSLQKISYPTGGSTTFDYEPHDTYGSMTTTNSVYRTSPSVGYDGQTFYSTTYTFTSNLYQVNLFNENYGSQSNLELVNSSNVIVKNFGANPGERTTFWFTIPAGTYTLKFYKNTTASSKGSSADFYEWVPTTTQGNLMVGGLRIKTTTSKDAFTTADVVTNYSYVTTGSTHSSGFLYSRPVYVSPLRNDILKMIGGSWSNPGCSQNGCNSCDGWGQNYYKSGSTIMPMSTTQGNHIGYEEVKVSQTGNGYSIFKYYGSNLWTTINDDVVTRNLDNSNCSLSTPNYPATPLPFEFKRGELKYEGHFTETGTAVNEKYYYPEFTMDSITTPAYICVPVGSIQTDWSGPGLWATEYVLQSGRKTREDVISFDTDISTGNYISNTSRVFYGSSFHNQPTRTVTFNSTGDSLITISKYAFDFRISTCDNINSGWQTYLNAYNIATSTFTNSLSCTSTPGHNCLWFSYQQWRYDKSVARKNFVAYRKLNFVNPTNNFKTAHDAAKNAGADANLKPILELQDQYMNPAIEVSSWKNNQLLKAGFTRYAYGDNPASAVYPSVYQEVNLSIPSTTFTAANTSANNQSVTKDSRYTDNSSFKFDAGNLVEITPRSGVITSYYWATNNSYPVVKADGVTYSVLKAAYTAAGGNPTTLRNQASLSGAMLSTYTYQPLLGMLSETNPSLQVVNYEYDALFRLLRLRDKDNYIIKQYNYEYQAYSHTNAVWQSTGATRCKPCPSNATYITNMRQHEEKDVNSVSSSYNTTRWVDDGVPGSCVVSADWQFEESPSCEQSGGQNTGFLVTTQRDMNPCSSTYNTTRPYKVLNTASCPIPCSLSNCSGVNKKCVNGICETGTKQYKSSVHMKIPDPNNPSLQIWIYRCTYNYKWSDCTISADFTEDNASPCSVISVPCAGIS
jgi:hypothetical protein